MDKYTKIEEIKAVISGHFGVDFLAKDRHWDVAYPRHIYAYCLYVFTPIILREIAEEVGYKDHSSVLHSAKKVREFCRYDPKIKQEVIAIESMIE